MNNVTFANPEFFYLLAIIPLLVVWYVLRQRNASPALTYSHTDQFAAAGSNWRIYLRHSLIVLRLLALAALIVVLARPQRTDKWQESSAEGINIMLVMDVSSSMLAEDFTHNRLEA